MWCIWFIKHSILVNLGLRGGIKTQHWLTCVVSYNLYDYCILLMTNLNWSLCHWLLLPLPLKQACAPVPLFPFLSPSYPPNTKAHTMLNSCGKKERIFWIIDLLTNINSWLCIVFQFSIFPQLGFTCKVYGMFEA